MKRPRLKLLRKRSRHTLAQDILFDFIVKAGHVCFRCGKKLNRNDFTIEHKVPWLGEENYLELYYDLENIAYSHLGCNIAAARKPTKKHNSVEERKAFKLKRARELWNELDKDFRKARRKRSYEKYGC